MIGTLARKRTNMVALAVLAALAVALFGALSAVSAGPLTSTAGTGNVSTCDGTNVTGIMHDADDDGVTGDVVVPCPEGAINGDWVRVTATDGDPDVEVLNLQVRIDISGDSDQVIPNDGTAVLTATPATRYNNIATDARNLWILDDSFNVSGELSFSSFGGTESGTVGSGAFSTDTVNTGWGDGTAITAMTIPIRAGTTEGEYTVSIVFLYDHDDDDSDNDGDQDDAADTTATKPKALVASQTITVGDPGQAAGSASISFGPRTFDDALTPDDESNEGAIFGAVNSSSSNVRLSLSVLNSLGNAAGGKGATGLSSLFVSASGAEITINQINPGGGVGDVVDIGTTGTHNASANIEDVNNSNFYLNVAPIDDEARSVTVSATVIGQDGSVAAAEPVDLAFSGDADGITLLNLGDSLFHYNLVNDNETESPGEGETRDTNNLDSNTFLLGATDSAGNALPVPNVRVVVTDAEGTRVSVSDIAPAQIDNPGSYTGNNSLLLLNNNAPKAQALDLGEYTVTVTNRADATQSAEATFFIVGLTDSVSLEVSDMAPSAIGDIVEVTVTVSDENGVAVADDTVVNLRASDASAGIDQVLVETGDIGAKMTEGGVATATFVAVGPGTSVITASADGKSAVAVVTSTAGASDADAADEAVTLDCLTETDGFSVYTCGTDSSASELFGLVSGRGATAVHLWNGTAWVRYSVVDGAMVPGSSDFTVTEDDILYISN